MKLVTKTAIASAVALLFGASAQAATTTYTFDGTGGIHASGYDENFNPVSGWMNEAMTTNAGLNPVNVLDNGIAGAGYQLTSGGGSSGVSLAPYSPFDALYSGSISVDDQNTVSTADDQYSGLLSWTGVLGYEGTASPGDPPGAGFFSILLQNGSWNLDTGAVTGTLLCRAKTGVAATSCNQPQNNTLSSYDMPLGVLSFVNNGSTVTFTLGSDDFLLAGGVHDQSPPLTGSLEQSHRVSLTLGVVPVPAAVWLFGSAIAGLGLIRRRRTA